MVESDEEYARRLLERYLKSISGITGACCKCVKNDPPDIVCLVANEKWAVEVTRIGQREVQNGEEKSRNEIDRPLLDFGRELGKKIEHLRRHKYQIILNGPPSEYIRTKWKKQVRKAVEQFVRSGCLGRCDFVGGSISAFNQGHNWQVVVGLRDDTSAPGGHMTSDIAANIKVMLRHALDDKCQKLGAVSDFDRIGLVLLNTYPFGDDIDEVKSSLCTVISDDRKYSVFDIVLYVTNGNLCVIYDKRANPVS